MGLVWYLVPLQMHFYQLGITLLISQETFAMKGQQRPLPLEVTVKRLAGLVRNYQLLPFRKLSAPPLLLSSHDDWGAVTMQQDRHQFNVHQTLK